MVNQQNNQVFGPRVKLPTFDGSSYTLDFLDWIDTIEDYFEAIDPPEAMRCKLAASKLKGEARTWWKELQNNRFSEGKNLITSWKRMRKFLLKRFLHTSRLTYFHNQPNRQENEDDVMHANCSTKVLTQFHSNGLKQIEDRSSKDEFHYSDTSITDGHKVAECENVSTSALKYDPTIDNKDTITEMGAIKLHVEETKCTLESALIEESLIPGIFVKIISVSCKFPSEGKNIRGEVEEVKKQVGNLKKDVGDAKEEQFRRRLCYENYPTNGGTLYMSFDPRGMWKNRVINDGVHECSIENVLIGVLLYICNVAAHKGRRCRDSRISTRFVEVCNFEVMNRKLNKAEIWGLASVTKPSGIVLIRVKNTRNVGFTYHVHGFISILFDPGGNFHHGRTRRTECRFKDCDMHSLSDCEAMNMQLHRDAYVLSHGSKRFRELIYMSNILNLKLSLEVKIDIKSAEITWMTIIVVILKSFIDTLGDHLVSSSIAEAALFLFDPGGSPIVQNVGYYLFPNYGIIFKNEVAKEVTLLIIAHIESTTGFNDVIVTCGSEVTIVHLRFDSWLDNLLERVHVFCVYDYQEKSTYELGAPTATQFVASSTNSTLEENLIVSERKKTPLEMMMSVPGIIGELHMKSPNDRSISTTKNSAITHSRIVEQKEHELLKDRNAIIPKSASLVEARTLFALVVDKPTILLETKPYSSKVDLTTWVSLCISKMHTVSLILCECMVVNYPVLEGAVFSFDPGGRPILQKSRNHIFSFPYIWHTSSIKNVKQHFVGDTIVLRLLTKKKESFVWSFKNNCSSNTDGPFKNIFLKFTFALDMEPSVWSALIKLDIWWLAKVDSDDIGSLPYEHQTYNLTKAQRCPRQAKASKSEHEEFEFIEGLLTNNVGGTFDYSATGLIVHEHGMDTLHAYASGTSLKEGKSGDAGMFTFDPGGWKVDMLKGQLQSLFYLCLESRKLICMQKDTRPNLNDVNDFNTQGMFTIAKLSVGTFTSCLSILCDDGHFKKTLRLFFKLVNGLDPPLLAS